MNDNHDTAPARDIRPEDFAAEVTGAVYPLMLHRGLTGSWMEVELGLWRVLAETIEKWALERPSAASLDQFDGWREGFLAELTDCVSGIALDSEVEAAFLDLELCVFSAFCQALRRHGRGMKPGG